MLVQKIKLYKQRKALELSVVVSFSITRKVLQKPPKHFLSFVPLPIGKLPPSWAHVFADLQKLLLSLFGDIESHVPSFYSLHKVFHGSHFIWNCCRRNCLLYRFLSCSFKPMSLPYARLSDSLKNTKTWCKVVKICINLSKPTYMSLIS